MASERRNAIVTGGASGLGRAIARRLARDGWNIAICDINEEAGKQTVDELRAAGGDGRFERLDVTQREEWAALSERLHGDWQHLDLLVNNAGVAVSGEVGQTSLDDWHWIINVNLWNGIYGCHTFIDWLKDNPNGAHIINTASLAAIASGPSMAAYNVTKAGMVALSETLYAELQPHNVGVTVLCPAFFATNLLKNGRFFKEDDRETAERAFTNAKMTADDVAEAAIKAMRKKKLFVVVPFKARRYWYLKRIFPQDFMKRVGEIYAKNGLRDHI